MKKLHLRLESLTVETFGTGAHDDRRGTAHAHVFGPVEEEPCTCGCGSGWTGRDTCEGESCLETCTFDTCLSCTEPM